MLPSLVSDFWYAISDRRKKMADRISVRPTMFATASVCIGWDTKKRLATRLVNTLVPNFKQNSINRTETRV